MKSLVRQLLRTHSKEEIRKVLGMTDIKRIPAEVTEGMSSDLSKAISKAVSKIGYSIDDIDTDAKGKGFMIWTNKQIVAKDFKKIRLALKPILKKASLKVKQVIPDGIEVISK